MISVIVPFYNAKEWLERCCKSLADNEGDFEFIFVDDESTDGGAEIVKAQTDPRFVLVKNQRLKGVSGARNHGIDIAKGEWVTFLDADDEFLPGAYKTFCRVIADDKRANVHQLNHKRYYTRIDKTALKYTNERGVYGFRNLPTAWFFVWNKIIKRDFLDGVRFDERLLYGEDSLFVLACLIKDNYIHHGEYEATAVRHRFDNAESLSRIKTPDDIRLQIKAHEELFDKQTDKTIRVELCGIISSLWSDAMVKRLQK